MAEMLMLLLLEWDWLPARPEPESRRVQVLQSGLLREDARKQAAGSPKEVQWWMKQVKGQRMILRRDG